MAVGNPGDLQPPPGEGARLAIGGYWPSISETDIQDIADEHRTAAKSFSDYAELLQQQMARSMEVLEGQGGNARIAQLTKMRDHAVGSADHTASKVTTAESYKSTVIGFKTTLIGIGDAAQEDWEKARSSKRVFDPTPYQGEAATAYSNSLKDIAKAPPPLPMPGEDAGDTGGQETSNESKDEKRPRQEEVQPEKETAIGEEPAETTSSERRGDELDHLESPSTADAAQANPPGDVLADARREHSAITPTPLVGEQGGMPISGLSGTGMPSGGNSPAGAGGAGLGGLKSPAQMPSAGSLSSSLGGKSLSDAATAPAASVSDAFGSSSGGGGGSLSGAANSFQSGLASGMGSSGAVSPPLEKFTGGPQHPAAAPLSATVGPQGPVAAAQGGPVAPPGGAPSGAGPMMGGGGAVAPMIPPSGAGAGGGALPPYVPPGAGTGGAVPPAGPSTAAAAGSSAPGPVQQGASTAAGGGAPVVAGSGAATAAGLAGDDADPDLLLAQRVLDGLVRGTRATAETFNSGFVQWAVSVLRSSSGTHVLIASSVGAGVYMPAGVCLPFPATIAPLDDVLPWGWGQRFLGWDKPVVLLAEHADEACERVVGLRRSALVTTDEQARRPAGWDEFAAVPLIRIVHSPGEAPVLDGGAYRHRLASLEHGSFVSPVERIMERGLGRDIGARITEATAVAVGREVAAAPAGTRSLIDAYDSEHVLGRLQRGQSVDWDAHWQHLIERDGGAVLHPLLAGGLLDLDDSEVSNHSRMVYMQYYRAGLVAEMLRCWRFDQPDLRDIAYCTLAAGFRQIVAEELRVT